MTAMGTAKEALSSAIKTLGRPLCDGIVAVSSVLSRRKNGLKSQNTLCDGIVAVSSVLSQREKDRRTAKTLCDGIVTILSVLSRRRSAGEEAEKRRSGGGERPYTL